NRNGYVSHANSVFYGVCGVYGGYLFFSVGRVGVLFPYFNPVPTGWRGATGFCASAVLPDAAVVMIGQETHGLGSSENVHAERLR
ncbi:hypothetical protein, partial [Nocardia abscessus]|uniref:hypothetical protein n=1 Tax=Nocardia abscessus TaxID=120957 RepID=UPI002456371F